MELESSERWPGLSAKAKKTRVSNKSRQRPKKADAPGLIRRLLGIIPALFVFLLAMWVLAFALLAPSMPDTDSLVEGSTQTRITLIAADGGIIAERGVEGRAYVKLNEMSPFIEAAVLATEDHRFYSHFGLDVIGTARAILANLRSGGVVAGGSTITQQLAKNLYLTPERSILRKLKELMLAIWLEARMEKEEILEVYLNRVYLGAGAYGVEAASQLYFAKPAADVNLAEAAMLAGLLKAPSRYAPTHDLKTAQARSATVARLMAERGFISHDEARSVADKPAVLNERLETGRADDFARYVLGTIADDLGKPEAGLVVRTTLDRRLQAHVEAVVEQRLAPHPQLQAAIVVLDERGRVQAMMGGRKRIGDHRNRATDARRQPGSAFKTIIYATAMAQGFTPSDQVTDEPFAVEGWSPRNAGGRFFGRISLEEAFARSVNSVAVKVSETAGRNEVIAMARKLGISSELKPLPSLALGTFEVTPLEMAAAYQPLIAHGVRYPVTAFGRIADEAGRVLYEDAGTSARVLSEQTVASMRQMLLAVVERGSGKAASVPGFAVGGKTGTTQNSRDAWFIGFAGRHIIAVWTGRDDQKGMKGISGSNLPAMIFRDIAAGILPNDHDVPLPKAKPEQPETAGAAREDGLKRLMDWMGGLFGG